MGRVKTFKVELCQRNEIKDFIEKWHYSRNINGLKTDFCFKLLDGEKLIGAMIYGGLGMAGVWRKYAKQENEVKELRRLCCIDGTPKNTESFFIGKTLRWLKKNTAIKRVVSYADPNYNHEGTIYKAANFKYAGMTARGRVILFEGKRYHDKTIRTKYKGKLKPYAERLKEALEVGAAEYLETKGKHIYIYEL